jgi:hypothetical protein
MRLAATIACWPSGPAAGLAVQALSDWRMQSRRRGLLMSFTNMTLAGDGDGGGAEAERRAVFAGAIKSPEDSAGADAYLLSSLRFQKAPGPEAHGAARSYLHLAIIDVN